MRWGHCGFTVIETLVALVIFAVIALGISSLMLANTRLISENAQSSEAIAVAQELLENLREVPVDALMSGSSSRTSTKGTIYNIAWIVTPETPAAGMTSVVVTVSWDHKGNPRSYEAESIFTKASS
ncbi:MAG: prepilin-type N-terminal cleavage/methylation domain-containing protein [Candidatus Binatia bacterium]